MALNYLLWFAAIVLAAAGLAGAVLPLLPGPILLFAGLLLGAWIDDFAYVGTVTLIVLGVMTALSYLCEIAGTALGAKRYGASRRAIIGAVIGGIVGLFFGIFGIVLGPFIGATIGELSVRRDIGTAARAGWGATVGLALAAAGKLALGVAMIGIFLVARFSPS
ncbi:MAG: hypothetical protein A2W18_09710 [Candidatus Muproteobacteria bacterium RBG_16_60_9]|uniref:DUF456 domain-containing protein n=1 Tax=Candidatus Muproteobacteria bacterium RBG_16_60_9 TaxID=1817755 RepID=A0A1F6VIS8_9PROT|nr:MAG: hypothetical protein A2W18_09710 [Candidatus Muproteobacteria bacterium RBG_16_60_9]